jgi:hypothetical protein
MTLAIAVAQFAAAQQVSQDPNATDPQQRQQQQSTNPDQQQDMNQTRQDTGMYGQQTAAGRQANESPKVTASHQAAIILQETDQARQAISQNNRTAAMSHVQRALSATNSLQALVPSGTQNVPIFAELEQTDVVGPLVASRGGMRGTARAARRAREQAQQQGEAARAGAMGQAPVVRETEGGFTSINVNVPMAKQHLEAAQTALQNNNTKVADASLAAVQQGVTMTSVQTDLPLVRARENLVLAQQYAQTGNMQQAAAPLQAAVNALQEYQRTSPSGRYKDQAAQLASQISSYTGNIQQQNTSAAPAQIRQWWDQLAGWTQSGNTQ